MANESSQQEAVVLKILEDPLILLDKRSISSLCDKKAVPVQRNRIDDVVVDDDDGFKRGKSFC